LLVLVNGQTASAAEVLAGALQDNQRATVLGSRTVGKGSVQTLIKLDDGGGAIKLTTAQYRLPGGRNIDRRADAAAWGIDPNEGFFVPLDAAQTQALLAKRLQREVLGPKGEPAARPEVTADWLETEQADPQLAAALKALSSRLATGEFAKVSQLTAAQIEQFLKREDLHRRRQAVLENLERLKGELAELEKEAGP
jgi:carboxyl-terminal processing protease